MTERIVPMKIRTRTPRFALHLALCIALGLTLVPSPPLRAEDFSFLELGARAAALGGAFTGKADDITAIFYNPAGLAFLGGVRLKTNLSFSARKMSATWPETGPTFPSSPRELGGSQFLAWRPIRGISLGLGYYSPYSFTSRWPRNWSGEDVSVAAKLNSQTFRSVVAVEPLKGLALSAALDLVSMSVRWEHKLPFELETYPLPRETMVTSLHRLSGRGVGFAAGVLWKVFSGLQVGARYQKSVSIDLAGSNAFTFPTTIMFDTVPDPVRPFIYVSQLLDLFYVPQDVTGRITLPREIAFGVVLTPIHNLSLCLDAQWDTWSEFGQWSFRSSNEGGDLNPDFTSEYRDFYGIVPDYGTQSSDLAVKDSKKLKAGLEYRAGKWFALRVGFARHESSVEAAGRTPLYPDPDLNIYSFGAGYEGPLFSIWDEEKTVSQLSFDLFIRYASADASASALPGLEMTYGAKRFVAGVGVGFIF
jgi:long-chain fatty acid transport protein